VLERRGKDVAALVSMDDLQTLEALEDAADLKAARRARKEKGVIALHDLRTELGITTAKRVRSARAPRQGK